MSYLLNIACSAENPWISTIASKVHTVTLLFSVLPWPYVCSRSLTIG